MTIPNLLTFVIVGGRCHGRGTGRGPIAEPGAPNPGPRSTVGSTHFLLKLILVEAGPRHPARVRRVAYAAAAAKLAKLGVLVRTGASAGVEKVDAEGVIVRGERIGTRNVFWAAAGKGSPASCNGLGAEADRAGRVKVLADCSVPCESWILVGGAWRLRGGGKASPGALPRCSLSPAAGRHGLPPPDYCGTADVCPYQSAFRYWTRETPATVGRTCCHGRAFGVRTAGLFAKLVWAFVHVQFLVLTSSRIGTLFRWSWKLFTRQRLARLIIEPEPLQDAIQAAQHNGQRTNAKAEGPRSNVSERETVQ